MSVAGSPGAGRPRVFIECTYSALYGGNSGIQRVVRNLANHCRQAGESEGVEAQPVMCIRGHWFHVKRLSQGKATVIRLRAYLVAVLHHFWLLVGAIFPLAALRRPHPRLRRAVKMGLLIPLLPLLLIFVVRLRRVHFRQGDILLLADASWMAPIWKGVDRARASGAKIGVIVYDLIVLESPKFFAGELVNVFVPWVQTAIEKADFFLAISRHVAGEVSDLLRQRPGRSNVPVESFPLGSDLDGAPTGGHVRGQLRDIFSNGSRPYIMVSTIEPRKNHDYVLDAFELAWSRQASANLLIIGKMGWKFEEFLRRVQTHPQLGRRLWMFHDVTDSELEFCYRGARALVTASFSEGFGLPIVESLRRNLPVLASDIDIHHEAGGDACAYFKLDDPQSLSSLVQEYESSNKFPCARPADPSSFTTWMQSCRELLRAAVRLSRGT